MKEQLVENLLKACAHAGLDIDTIDLEYPENSEHGDFTTNVALVHAKQLKLSPRALADTIVEHFRQSLPEFIHSVDVAGAGFINFKVTDSFFATEIISIANSKKTFGRLSGEKGRKIMIEYTQPNPFKEFHIGHLMNNTIGESISRLIEWNGAEVKRATYHGDVGLHVAKAVWVMQKKEEAITAESLGRAYAAGSAAYESDENSKKEIIEINKKIYDRSDETINALYDAGRKVSFDYFESMYARLGSSFDFHFYESEAGSIGKELVIEFLKKGIFEESEGAVVFKGEPYGLHTRVFLSREKLPTYEGKELGLAKIKHDIYSFDQSITITANEQDAYFKVVECAIGKIFPEMTGSLSHISHGMLRMTSGKMSSRLGNIISSEALLQTVSELVAGKIVDRKLEEKEAKEIAETVALGAIKYSILRQSIGGDTIFDAAKSISFEGDSGPYLQYATVRAASVLEKAAAAGIEPLSKSADTFLPEKVSIVEKLISRFPDIVARARNENAPQHVAGYLIMLAGSFNAFYANQIIIDAENPTSAYYVTLTKVFHQVMTHGLWILGISVPHKM